MTLFGNPEDWQCMIEQAGNTVKVQKNTETTYNKYGDATDTTGDFVEVKAVTQYLSFEDEMVQQGLFRSGDLILWIAGDDVGECSLELRNKVIFNFQMFEIRELIPHIYDDTLYMYELRVQKV